MIPPLSDALAERGYDTLTAVQEAVTAPDLDGADLLVSAQTGSGKTVGFGLAVAPTLLGSDLRFGPAATPLGLVVAPTRELAFQVMQELKWLYARTGAVVTACVGGMDIRQERRALERGTHIVVGTPGRLCDHIRRDALDLGAIRAVVLDEADEMLDLGFREDLEFILGSAPADRRTLLFSATVSAPIAKLAQQFQRDAKRISTTDGARQHADIAYRALRVAATDADHAIFNLLRYHDEESAIVFANTRAAVNHLAARLGNRGLPVVTLSGELSQTERTHALQAMRDGRARVCVATDVAARGIDLPNLNLVIHADLPTNTESLLHRSGRTGRAGRKGMSALIVPPKSVKKAERLLKWAKISAEWDVPPSAEAIQRRDEEKLLTDPGWDAPVTEEQAAFAARLLDRHGPEAVAAALLRLHQARHAAPEDLQVPESAGEGKRGEKRPARDHAAFGPSRWFALSVGRAKRAEPRWLLPLVLRAADLEKSAIGAIRVQQEETFIEIAEAQAARFDGALDADGVIADGIVARPSGAPPLVGPRGRDTRGKGDKPAPMRRPDGDDAADAPRKPRKTGDRAEPAPYPPAQAGPAASADPDGTEAAGRAERPAGAPANRRDAEPARKPRTKPGAKPAAKSFDKPGARGHERPRSKAPRTGFGDKDGAGALKGGKPGASAKRPAAGPDARGKNAAGAGKPSVGHGKRAGPGGLEPPRRGKR